jgi:hypothetical protein
MFPQTDASQCFAELGRRICKRSPVQVADGSHFFWQELLTGNFV